MYLLAIFSEFSLVIKTFAELPAKTVKIIYSYSDSCLFSKVDAINAYIKCYIW
jgi:hypothetical protein